MDVVRIASVPFVNAQPLTWGFLRGPYRGIFHLQHVPPSGLPRLLAEGHVDIGLIPSIEYLGLPGVELLPQLCVASKRRVRSVYLASKVPLDRIESVAVDRNSRTSVALLKIILWHKGVKAAKYVEREPALREMLREHDAALLIGDAALTADTTGLVVSDLAAEWFALTGLPFVFALWAVRPGVVVPDGVRPFLESRRIGMAQIPAIALQTSERLKISPESIESYLRTNIHYYLGSEEQRGLELFFRFALELGLTNRSRPLRFRGPLEWERAQASLSPSGHAIE